MRKMLVGLSWTVLLVGLAASVAVAGQPLVSPLICGSFTFPEPATSFAARGHVIINAQGDLQVSVKGVTPNSVFDCSVLCPHRPGGVPENLGLASCGTSNSLGHLTIHVPGLLASILEGGPCGGIEMFIGDGEGLICVLGVPGKSPAD
jgi:hypothetical protein